MARRHRALGKCPSHTTRGELRFATVSDDPPQKKASRLIAGHSLNFFTFAEQQLKSLAQKQDVRALHYKPKEKAIWKAENPKRS
jgi:hypothetical protein